MHRLILLAVALSFVSCRGIGEVLRKYGYTEVRPASTLFPPGTLVYVKTAKPFEAGVVCTAEAALGSDFKPMESKTMSSEMNKAKKYGANLDVDVENLVSANAELHDVRSMKMTLSNAIILEVNDADIDSHSANTSRACLRQLTRRRRAGYEITMVSSALKADVSYTISWDKGSKLSADAKAQALANLSAKLGIEGSVVSDRTIHAEGLYWGIRDDQFLAYLFAPENLPAVDRGSRAMDPNLVANFIGSMDAARANGPLPALPKPMGTPGSYIHSDVEAESLPGSAPSGSGLPGAQFSLTEAGLDGDDSPLVKLFP